MLNRNICFQCMVESTKDVSPYILQFKQQAFERAWLGLEIIPNCPTPVPPHVHCLDCVAQAHGRKNIWELSLGNPPLECPYYLEHILQSQKDAE